MLLHPVFISVPRVSALFFSAMIFLFAKLPFLVTFC